MTTYNRATLKTFFETNDVPDGTDYANFIDSCLNIVDTAEQSIASNFVAVKLIAPDVSAATINVTNTLSANTAYVTNLNATNFTISQTISAAAVRGVTGFFIGLSANNANFNSDVSVSGNISLTGTVSAAAVNVTGDVSAATGTVYASALRTANGILNSVVVISAAGSTQAGAASLGTTGIIRLKGIADGQTTGFRLLANLTGLQQTLWVEENTSCNLWPCTGGQINALSSNAAFAMTGNTQYVVTHIKASGYSVK